MKCLGFCCYVPLVDEAHGSNPPHVENAGNSRNSGVVETYDNREGSLCALCLLVLCATDRVPTWIDVHHVSS
jgi:hypothetical protein